MAYKQHFIDWCSGKGGTNRTDFKWVFRSISGTSGAMESSIDGGFKLSASSAGNSRGEISFNDNSRPFDLQNSVLICVNKSETIANVKNWVGLLRAKAQNDDFGQFGCMSDYSSTKNSLNTYRGGSESNTQSSRNMDTDWHVNKIDFSSGDVNAYVDGNLEITKTTDLPIGNAQPVFWINGLTSNSTEHSMRYLEVYNK